MLLFMKNKCEHKNKEKKTSQKILKIEKHPFGAQTKCFSRVLLLRAHGRWEEKGQRRPQREQACLLKHRFYTL